MSHVSRQGQIYSIDHKKAYAAQTYTDKKSLEFTVNLAATAYTNYSSMCVVLPIQIKKKADNAADIDGTLMTVNNFFWDWLKEIDIKRYPDEVSILPTNDTVEIYRYAAQILKHMPKKHLTRLVRHCSMKNKKLSLQEIETDD